MIKLEQLQPSAAVRGIVPDAMVVVVSVSVRLSGSEALELTKRYRLRLSPSTLARHFLQMTATPHYAKEAD
jgi:hypothetical protein